MVRLTNDCHVLRYLGSDGHVSVVYDNRLDKVFRIPLGDVAVATSTDCPGPAPLPDPGIRSASITDDGSFGLRLPRSGTTCT